MSPPFRCQSISLTTCRTQILKSTRCSRYFSTTRCLEARRTTVRRRIFNNWLSTHGARLANPNRNKPNYMRSAFGGGDLVEAVAKRREEEAHNTLKLYGGKVELTDRSDPRKPKNSEEARPFPLNPYFISQPLLPLAYREATWRKVMLEGKSVREVSVEMGIDMRRVGAVVRMMEIEKRWKREGKEIADFYQDAVISMLPPFKPVSQHQPFESINDLPVHAATTAQIFYPTSESHQFTRVDAAKVFQDDLLPADDRIPHPQMIEISRDKQAGLSGEELAQKEKRRKEAVTKKRDALIERDRRREEAIKKIEGRKYIFRIQECDVDEVGKNGRGKNGVGWRYGMPFMDRKKGQHKIPRTAGL